MTWQFYFWVYTQKNWKQSLYPKEYWRSICTPIFTAALFTIAKSGCTQVLINGWMEKQNVVYTYNGILFSLKKEGNSDTCYNRNEPWGYYAKWNKPVTQKKDKYRMILFIWGQIHRT